VICGVKEKMMSKRGSLRNMKPVFYLQLGYDWKKPENLFLFTDQK